MKLPRGVLAILVLLISYAPVDAQIQLRGRVLDVAGAPVAGQRVVLHAVGGGGGAPVADATSNEEGRFELVLAAPDPEAIYFAAVLWNGRVYLGPTLRGTPSRTDEYEIQVGGQSGVELGGGGVAAPNVPRERPWRAAFFVFAPLALLLGWLFVRRRDPGQTSRETLLALAELEERRTKQKLEPEEYERARNALRATLLARPLGG